MNASVSAERPAEEIHHEPGLSGAGDPPHEAEHDGGQEGGPPAICRHHGCIDRRSVAGKDGQPFLRRDAARQTDEKAEHAIVLDKHERGDRSREHADADQRRSRHLG